jgi:hypothetical protein
MRKKNIKKVISLLEELDSLTVDLVADKLKISKIEAESIFKYLIVNEYVLNLSSKTGFVISASKYVDYKSLSKDLAKTTNNRTKIIKWIGWIIMIAASLLAIRWYILNY